MHAHVRLAAAIAAAVTILAGCAATAANEKPTAGTSAVVAKESTCLTVPDRRFPVNKDCTEFGRSYSQEDISRTGKSTVAGALPLMDPLITIRQ